MLCTWNLNNSGTFIFKVSSFWHTYNIMCLTFLQFLKFDCQHGFAAAKNNGQKIKNWIYVTKFGSTKNTKKHIKSWHQNWFEKSGDKSEIKSNRQ